MFIIHKIGADILVVSHKHIEEVRRLSRDTGRSIEPFIHDFAGELVGGIPFLESDLQTRVVQQKLTPNLKRIMPIMEDELDFALTAELPKQLFENDKQWITLDMNHTVARIIGRVSARVFLGPEHCRNEQWLNTTAEYTENLFVTGTILRFIPRLLRPWIAPWIPSYKRLQSNMSTARSIIDDILRSRQVDRDELSCEDDSAFPDMLTWMMRAAQAKERDVEDISQRTLLLSLSSIHTTALTITQALYDLCQHPQYFEPLREEVARHVEGGRNWTKETVDKLHKMDSLLRESQRLNPVFLCKTLCLYSLSF